MKHSKKVQKKLEARLKVFESSISKGETRWMRIPGACKRPGSRNFKQG